jgi:conjugative relaxase-like TrwC/TraI family protein
MLRVTQQDSSQGAKRYYASADYYSEGQEIIGSWGGRAAEMLGLRGVVDKDSFDRLCDNFDPRDGKPLTVRTRSERTVGYDFTFSLPKSVSLLYALSGDREILAVFRAAVDETMRDVESEMKTRVRRGGRDEDRVTGNMAWAEFIHTTSRPVDGVPDPQLHAHCFVFNATWDDQERRFKAGQFRQLKADAPYFQAAFRVRLAGKLQDLGFGVQRKRDDFEIAGVTANLLKRFSRRTEVIEKTAQERGISDPKRKSELGAATRETKNHELGWDELRQHWDNQLTDQERRALATTHCREAPYARPVHGEEQAVDYALDQGFAREAVVPERKLLTEALKRGIGAVTVEKVKSELKRRPLIRGEQGGRAMATTRDVLAGESRLIALARDGRGRFRPLGNLDRPVTREKFNEGQRAALRHVLGSRDLVTILRGAAGTGKTTLEQELGEALAEAGQPVVALAPTAEASRSVLRQEAGFAEADTVARFLKDERMQDAARGGVVLVDEASLLGTRDMLRLLGAAQGVEARVVLVGDRKQHRSVAAGEPLKLLEEKAGLPVVELTEILRQSGDYLKAAQHLSQGDTAEGFAELGRLGWIREVPDADRYQQLAAAYLEAVQEKKRSGEVKSALVVSPTHGEAALITGTIRAALKKDGRLGEERTLAAWVPAHLTDAQKGDAANYDPGDMLQFHQNAPGHNNGSRLVVAEGGKLPLAYPGRFEVYRPATLTLAVGDRGRVTANGKTKDGMHRLNNGDLFTVKGFTLQGDIVTARNWIIARDFGHLAHGFVVTSHASQGKTVDKVFIGQSSLSFPASSRRQFYVSVSRGREQALVFTDDKRELLKAVERPDEPLSATEFAQTRRRKPQLRQRLRKHLATMRRLAAFAQTHEQWQPHPQLAPSLQREKRETGYVR